MTPDDLPDELVPPDQGDYPDEYPEKYNDPFPSAPAEAEADPFAITPPSDEPQQSWDAPAGEPPAPEFPQENYAQENSSETPAEPTDPLEKIKDFSEKLGATPAVPAAFPFSLLIEGPLSDYEKEKLLDLLSRENMGIREVDLEPQFISQRILIPRISEFAGVLLVQALRGTRAQLRLGPSDSIFTTEDTRDPEPPQNSDAHFNTGSVRVNPVQGVNRAEQIRISADPSLPDLPGAVLLDLVMASAALEADTVEAHQSTEYQEVMDALIRELKYKAFRKGAQAIANFSFELVSLSLPSQYRLTVSGYALGNPPESTPSSAASEAREDA